MNNDLQWMRRLMVFAFGSTLALAGGPLSAQVTLPEGPVRIVIPTTPGSTPDIMARAMTPRLGERLGRSILVDNKVGAGGMIGTDAVAKANPNGSTLLLAASSFAAGATLFKSLPFDPVRDLTPIALIGWNRLVLVTHPGTGFKNIGDVIAAARKAPGRLTYSSPGVGTPNHLAVELFKLKTGTFITHIPYGGSGPQLTGLLGGQVDVGPLTVNVAAPLVKSGKLIALAITGSKRSSLLPETLSLSEANVPGVDGDIWYGLFGPKGMAPELVAMLNRDVNELLHTDDISTNFKSRGFELETGTPEAFRKLVTADVSRWAALIKTQGIKAE
jgi:tripartite-type tricarboxylate transporter receptor subunit TctC